MHLKSIFVLFLIFIVKATHLYHSFISSSLYLVRCLIFRLPFFHFWHQKMSQQENLSLNVKAKTYLMCKMSSDVSPCFPSFFFWPTFTENDSDWFNFCLLGRRFHHFDTYLGCIFKFWGLYFDIWIKVFLIGVCLTRNRWKIYPYSRWLKSDNRHWDTTKRTHHLTDSDSASGRIREPSHWWSVLKLKTLVTSW